MLALPYLQGFGEDGGFAGRFEGGQEEEEGAGWVSKAAVFPMVAVAWLSPMPSGGLEQMGNPAVSPRVDVQLRQQLLHFIRSFFASEREFLRTSLCVNAC